MKKITEASSYERPQLSKIDSITDAALSGYFGNSLTQFLQARIILQEAMISEEIARVYHIGEGCVTLREIIENHPELASPPAEYPHSALSGTARRALEGLQEAGLIHRAGSKYYLGAVAKKGGSK